MSYTLETIDDMHGLLVALARGLFPTLDVSRLSFPSLFAKVIAAAAVGVHSHVDSVRKDLLPWSAEGDALDAWGVAIGVARKGATPSRRSAALRLANNSGTGESITTGRALVHASGLRFAVNQDVTVAANSTADVDVIAVDVGSATRLDVGEILTFVTPPAHVEDSAELQLALTDDGTDKESDGDYQARVLSHFSAPPLGGAQNDYVQWSLQISGISRAYVYPNRNGLGTVDVAALHSGSGSARLLNPTERGVLQAYLDTVAPVHATVRVIEVMEQLASVEVLVRDNGQPQYAWDWIDPITPPSVSSWNSTTRSLTFSAALPDGIVVGSRLTLKKTDGTGSGEVLRVQSVTSTTVIVLETAPTVAPVSGDVIYAASTLSSAVRTAIINMVNALGTANPDAASYGSWDANLRLAALFREVTGVAGVMDAQISSPSANIEAVDPWDFPAPGNAHIWVLSPSRVIVRRLA